MIGSGRAGWVHLGKRERGREGNSVCVCVCVCVCVHVCVCEMCVMA